MTNLAAPAPERTRPRQPPRAARLEADRWTRPPGALAALDTLSTPELRARLQALEKAPPPRLSRDLLLRAVSFRIQAQAAPSAARLDRRLARLAATLARTGKVAPARRPRLKPGARMIRDWGGRTHAVTAAEAGFIYDGKTYGSLSEIARAITGARWSGPRFFGLKAKTGSRRKSPGETTDA
ncbi:MAG: DUF2924 domain-containing protein [Hyphomicrobiales bacterium]|nr:DUF2924 domain-containing protein [Hyphomicrobiales bacterium]